MSSVRTLAIACSDLHLSLKPPAYRAAEPDWLARQSWVLTELVELCVEHDAPLLIAGDVFDRWNSPVELVNMVIDVFAGVRQYVIMIPGQHDLPNHNLDDVHRSAYYTLEQAGVATSLVHVFSDRPASVRHENGIEVVGFPWGVSLDESTLPVKDAKTTRIALVHKYVWIQGTGYPHAPAEGHARNVMRALPSCDYIISGDNHRSFQARTGGTSLVNCGTLMIRKRDEANHRPHVAVITTEGVEPHYLDTSHDVYLDSTQPETETNPELIEFVNDLRHVEAESLDYEAALKQYAQSASPAVRQKIFDTLAQCRK
jgi:DNA repair exonuclease SbcCD nuclease subunit